MLLRYQFVFLTCASKRLTGNRRTRFIILIGLSGLFSSAETAFMSVSKIRVKTVSEDEEDPHHAKALIVSNLLEDTDHLLSTILVGNNLVNILASSLTTSFVISVFGNEGTGVCQYKSN